MQSPYYLGRFAWFYGVSLSDQLDMWEDEWLLWNSFIG